MIMVFFDIIIAAILWGLDPVCSIIALLLIVAATNRLYRKL